MQREGMDMLVRLVFRQWRAIRGTRVSREIPKILSSNSLRSHFSISETVACIVSVYLDIFATDRHCIPLLSSPNQVEVQLRHASNELSCVFRAPKLDSFLVVISIK